MKGYRAFADNSYRHLSILFLMVCSCMHALGASVVVRGDANIYGAGHPTTPVLVGGAGTIPPHYQLPVGANRLLRFSKVVGTVSNVNGQFHNPPDGSQFPSALTAFGGLSGFTAPTVLCLVGVFFGEDEPHDPPP